MQLSAEQKLILEEHIKKKMPGGRAPKCPLCGHGEWTLDGFSAIDDIDVLKVNREEYLQRGNSALIVVAMTCSNCYYIVQYVWPRMRGDHG